MGNAVRKGHCECAAERKAHRRRDYMKPATLPKRVIEMAADLETRAAERRSRAASGSVMDRLMTRTADLGDSQASRDIKVVCEQLGAMIRRSLYVCAHRYDKDAPVGTRVIAIEDLKAETERALKLLQPK
jgi:hypothetical protein